MRLVKVPCAALIVLVVSLWLAPGGRAQESAGADHASNDLARQAQALLDLSERQNRDNHALALQTAQQSLALWQAAGDSVGLARAYAHIGRCYFAQSELPEAIQHYERALQLWRDMNNPQEQAEVLIMLGYIEERKGEWQNAISLLTQAQSLIEEKNDPIMLGQIASGLGYIFSENGAPENGLVQYQRALDYYRQVPNVDYYKQNLWTLGSTYYLQGDYPKAIASLQQALDGLAPDSLHAALCHEYLGRVYLAAGAYPAALEHLQAALPIYTRGVNPQEVALVHGLMGQVYQQQGQLERARQNYRQALTTFGKLSDRLNQAAIDYALGRLELRSGNYDAAEDYLRQSIEATENIRRVATSSDLTAAFSATVHERYETYIECLMRKQQAAPAQNLAVHAFETSELARARSLVELLRATETNLVPGLDPQLAEQEKSLRQMLRVKEDDKVALLGRAYKQEEVAALEAEQAGLEAQYKQITDTIRARYPAYEQIASPVAWDLQRIQTQVVADDQTVLLEYSLGAERSYVWAVTRDNIASYELPAQAQIGAAAQKVYNLLATQPDAETENRLTQATQALSQMVLSPVAAELNKRRVIVVADGALNYIPFQVLPAPAANGESLIANYEVVNAPSASILGELQAETARRRPATKLLAAFGDPVFASNYAQRKDTNGGEQIAAMQTLASERWPHALRGIELAGDAFDPASIKPLFYAKSELANLRRLAPAGTSFVAADFDATRARLQSTDLTGVAILHFATHGFLNPAKPEFSGLMLSTVDRNGQAQDGFIGLQDIYNLHAPVELVVLSACRTALGKEMRGEGLIGLTRGFMYAGATSVVASLWKVDDEATTELMKHFYSNMLQQGMPPAAALRAAQNSIRQQPQWHAPYYWAAFTLQGQYRQVIKVTPGDARPMYAQLIIGVVLLALLPAAAWQYRRRRRLRRA
jgi:CHAT domain-containing protein